MISSRLLWIVVIVAAIAIGFMAYPRSTVSEDTTPNPAQNTTPTGDTVKDIDGNVYKTVKIGNQTWMAENLRVTKYNDGSEIPQVWSGSAWGSLTTPSYCWLDNEVSNKDFGALYNWYAVEAGKLAPKGWHIPSDEEWATLSKQLGGDGVAGGKMKENGTSHWFSPNSGATNESGFLALPCSTRNYDGQTFYVVGDGAYFWTSTEFDAYNAWVRSLLCDSSALKSFHAYKSYGRSVRCLKDSPRPVPAADTVVDIEGNVYRTVKIGNQVWMAENLRTTHLNDGTPIPNVTDAYAWDSLRTSGYCWYNNDISNKVTYGGMYNWYAVNTGKLAPQGWHVPTEDEWMTLINYLGGVNAAGGKLKEVGTSHWASPNTGATDEVGFTALPSGYRGGGGMFFHLGGACFWWSSTEASTGPDGGKAWRYSINYIGDVSTCIGSQYFNHGWSIRCVKD